MTGISSLFPAFPKQMSILDRVNINVARHKNDYFKNWTSQQLDDIDNNTRPIEPVTPEIYSERIKKNEVSRNKKLTQCINMATSENAPNWAKDFLQELSSGAINSTTKAKDQATILWRENSSSYDSKRAVQVPSQQPTGHAVKRKRQDDETEYQYRKRLLANTQDNNEDDIADDPNIETAIKNSLHDIMRMTKQQLQQNISNSQETVDVLRQHTVFKNKTIEDLRICLITTAVYEHLNN